MQKSNVSRQSNIELLRILSMFGVIILHYNNAEIGGAFLTSNPMNKVILYGFESLCICAVNVYLLISAFFLSKSESRKWNKPAELLVQVVLFDAGLYVLRILMGKEGFAIKSFIFALLPDNYFVILYIACFFVSPMINIAFRQLGKERARQFLLMGVVILSVWPTLVDTLQDITGESWIGLSSISISGSQSGYTIANFLLVYAIGAYLGIYGFEAIVGDRKYKTSTLLSMQMGMLVLILLWTIIFEKMNFGGCSAWDYCNPLVIMEAVLLFVMFSRFRIPNNKWINQLAKGSFTVYLLHIPLLSFVNISDAVQGNSVYMIVHMLVTVVMVYLICFVVYLIYEGVTRPIYKRIWR